MVTENKESGEFITTVDRMSATSQNLHIEILTLSGIVLGSKILGDLVTGWSPHVGP